MPVDEDRQKTAQARRRNIISSLSANFDVRDDSPVSRLGRAIADEAPRTLVVNSDVDGLTAAMMLASVSNWRIGALVDKYGYRTTPGVALPHQPGETREDLFGVDVFSPLFSNVSNHPIFFGPKPGGDARLKSLLTPFDESMRGAAATLGVVNAAAWAGIEAMGSSESPTGMPYKYPLGTAQLMLAALEGSGNAPKFFDRQYLPWLVANCDGGLETIRIYSWNAEMWWSALAAVVGPASLSEHIFQTAATQRPGQFLDTDRRLRYEEPNRSLCLNTKWNLADDRPETISTFVGLVMDWTGWPDPFIGGHDSISGWDRVSPTRATLKKDGLTNKSDDEIKRHLDAAKRSIHMGFSSFDGAIRLGWSLATSEPDVEATVPETASADEPVLPSQ